jgi:hypothetical protein
VLTNLISNAEIHHWSVRLTVDTNEAGLTRFTVIDTGVASRHPEGTHLRAFPAGGRSHHAPLGGRASGWHHLAGLTELMGGTLDCQSTPGHGATFRASPAPYRGRQQRAECGRDRHKFTWRCVCCYDDQLANRKVIEIMLSETAELVMVENGAGGADAHRRGVRPGADGHADAGDGRPDRTGRNPGARGPEAAAGHRS